MMKMKICKTYSNKKKLRFEKQDEKKDREKEDLENIFK